MKGMNIDKVINFPFPTPPDRQSLQQAERVSEVVLQWTNIRFWKILARWTKPSTLPPLVIPCHDSLFFHGTLK